MGTVSKQECGEGCSESRHGGGSAEGWHLVGSCWAGTAEWVQFSCQLRSAHSDILNSPKLAEELQDVSLGSLLPPKQIRLLEATFLSNEAVSPLSEPGSDGDKKLGEAQRQTTRAASLSGTSR